MTLSSLEILEGKRAGFLSILARVLVGHLGLKWVMAWEDRAIKQSKLPTYLDESAFILFT